MTSKDSHSPINGRFSMKTLDKNNNKNHVQILEACIKNKKTTINKIEFNTGTNLPNIFNNYP